MERCLTGTSGYDYLDWKQTFYPLTVPREEWPGWYADRFDAVELGSFFLTQPEASDVTSLLARFGARLVFAVKVHRSLTHEVDPARWRDEARSFREGLTPLVEAGRLGCLLFVFPKTFLHDEDRRRYLGELLDFFADWPKAVEFRNPDWLIDRVFEGLRRRSTAWVGVDTPALGGLPTVCDMVTAPWAYFRFHGRHEAGWWGSGASARYNYRYTPEELESLSARVLSLVGQVERTFVFFNNHPAGQAALDAQAFRRLVTPEGQRG